MPTDTPPTIDPVAAARWQRAAPAHSPWLHEEVARRMESRLQWMILIFLLIAVANCKLAYVATVFRHGARYPLSDIFDGNQTK